jgi:hypothetical protein
MCALCTSDYTADTANYSAGTDTSAKSATDANTIATSATATATNTNTSTATTASSSSATAAIAAADI